MSEGSFAVAGAPPLDITLLLSTRLRISAKLVDESDYPAWSVEAQQQLWGNDLIEVVIGGEKEQPTGNNDVLIKS